MPESKKPKVYTAREAAHRLGISLRMLGYYRRDGRIEGIEQNNATFYTEEQLKAADLSKRKPGPKKALKNEESEEEPECSLTSCA